MKHIRKFNESSEHSFDETFPNWEHDDEKVLIQEDLGIELMGVIRSYYEKYGIDEVKKYLSQFLDDFDNETYINDYFNSPN